MDDREHLCERFARQALGAAAVTMRPLRCAADNRVYRAEADDGASLIVKHGNRDTVHNEHRRLRWLAGRDVPVADVLAYQPADGRRALLATAVLPGRDLAALAADGELDGGQAAELVGQGLALLHQLPVEQCPFGRDGGDTVVGHGDPCLANFLSDGERITGIIDVGGVAIAARHEDLQPALWSLAYNFAGCDFKQPLLRAYHAAMVRLPAAA